MSASQRNSPKGLSADPAPDCIFGARFNAHHTQTQAAAEVYAGLRTWQQWESGARKMPRASYELYLLKTGQATLAEVKKIN